MMKFLLSFLLIAQAAAFTTPSAVRAETRLFADDYVPLEGETKMNLKVRKWQGQFARRVCCAFRTMGMLAWNR